VCGIGLGCILNFKLCNTQVYSIPLFLDYCIFVFMLPRSVCVFLRCSRSTLLGWFAKGNVFLEGFKVTTLVSSVCNMVLIAWWITQWFLGSGCSSWCKSEPV